MTRYIKLAVYFWGLLIMAHSAWGQDALTVQQARKSVTLSGYTHSCAKLTIASEVTGKVVAVHYDVGQTIGELPFLQIDPTFIDFQIEQLTQSLAKLTVAASRNRSQKTFLKKEFNRIDRLHRDNAATAARWEAAAEQLDQADLAVQATYADLKAAEVQLKELKERRKRHSVNVAQGWIVVQRHVEPGEIIAAGGPVGQIADFSQLVVPLFVSAAELSAIQRITQIELSLEGQTVRAVLSWVNPEFNEQTRKLAIELALQDYSGERRGGLQAELTFEVPTDGLMVPKAAVTDQYDNPCVFLSADNQKVPIAILAERSDYWLIAETADLTVGSQLKRRP